MSEPKAPPNPDAAPDPSAQLDSSALLRPAVFLDRDGTLIEHVHHLRRWEDVRLVPGAAATLNKLRAAGFVSVVVTNQSVVGRGMLDLEGLDRIHRELDAQLARENARLDALYYCTHSPAVSDQQTVEHPDRKPGPGMLLRAAQDHGLDLSRSWMIGDSLSDLLAGKNAGCRASILVMTGYGNKTFAETGWHPRAADMNEAADRVLSESRTAR
jgi:D-glycero-D-manno-heptose 1,7-bisphosphate phosphatase